MGSSHGTSSAPAPLRLLLSERPSSMLHCSSGLYLPRNTQRSQLCPARTPAAPLTVPSLLLLKRSTAGACSQPTPWLRSRLPLSSGSSSSPHLSDDKEQLQTSTKKPAARQQRVLEAPGSWQISKPSVKPAPLLTVSGAP